MKRIPAIAISVGAAAVARFYEAAFGMQEVNRIAAPGGPEVFVNFGATVITITAGRDSVIGG